MSISERPPVPNKGEMISPFAWANVLHDRIKSADQLRRLPEEKIVQATRDYLNACVEYFANKVCDDYLQEVGKTAEHAINQRSVLVLPTKDLKETLRKFGVSSKTLKNTDRKDPFIIFHKRKSESTNDYYTVLFIITPELIIRAKEKPIEALATMLHYFSNIRDFVNGRLDKDTDDIFELRAKATQAHFLKEVIRQYPDIDLGSSYSEVLSEYPDGIDSLPEGVVYWDRLHGYRV